MPIAALFLLLNKPIKEPGFDQGLACDTAKLRGVIQLLKHVRGHIDIEPSRLKTRTPKCRRVNAQRKNIFTLVKAAVEFLSGERRITRGFYIVVPLLHGHVGLR